MNRFSFSAFRFAALVIACGLSVTTAVRAQNVWTGGGADNNWSTPQNWQGNNLPLSGADIVFTGSTQTTNNNDFAPNGISLSSLDFDANADAFTLQGLPISFFTSGAALNTITNDSTNLQTISFSNSGAFGGITVADNNGGVTINAAVGDIHITSDIFLYNFSNLGGSLTFEGPGTTTLDGAILEFALPASVTINGPGAVQFNASSNYSGGTVINSGTAIVNAFEPFGLGNVALVDGTLRTLEGTPTSYFVGNYVQFNGTVIFQIGGTLNGFHDDMLSGGFADLPTGFADNGTLFLHRVLNFNPVPGDFLEILHAPSGVFGEWAGAPNGSIAPSDFVGLIQPFITYNSTDVVIDFELTNTFASQGLTRNQICVGENLDAAVDLVNTNEAAHTLVGIIGSVLPADLPEAFDLLAPEELASMYEISFQHGIMQMSTYRQRMDDLRATARGYCGDVEAAPQSMEMRPDGKTVMDGKDKNVSPVVETCPDKRWGMFATGYGQGVNVDDDEFNHVNGYRITTGGFSTGFDALVTHNIAIGVGGGYAQSTADLVNDGRVDVETGYVAAYATAFFGGFYVDGAATGGWSTYDTSRLGFGGFEDGETEGAEFNGIIGAGYDWRTHCFTIGPFATFHYSYVEFDNFDEHGTSIAPLHFPDQNQDAERGAIGLKVSYDMTKGNIIFRPELRAAFQHEFNNTDYAIDWSFRDISDDHICSVFGPSTGRDSALIDAGFSLILGKCHNVSAFAFYSGNIGRENDTRHGANGGLRLSF